MHHKKTEMTHNYESGGLITTGVYFVLGVIWGNSPREWVHYILYESPLVLYY